MTTTQKWILGLVAVFVIAALFFWRQIADLYNQIVNVASKRVADDAVTQPSPTVQPIIVPVIPGPNPNPATCDSINGKINWVKAKLAGNPNPTQKAALEKILDGLNKQYVALNCGGGPNPVPQA